MRTERSEKMTKDSIWNMKTKSSNLKVKKISLRCQKFQISDKFRQTDYKIILSIYFTRRWLIETIFSAPIRMLIFLWILWKKLAKS